METTTEFMYSDDSEEVDIALKSSITKLTVKQFVAVTGFKIDDIMFNEFWQVVMNRKACTHVHARLLEWIGYEGRNSKLNFIAYLKRNEFAYDEISFDDNRAANYPSIQQEMDQMADTNMGTVRRAKWLVMNSRDFKKAIMKLSTKRGDSIREYYLRVEELLKLFLEYERRFETRRLKSEKTELQDKLDKVLVKLDNVMIQNNEQLDEIRLLNDKNDEILGNLEVIQDKLEIAVEDRAPKTVAVNKRERFVLFKKNDPATDYNYYVIRGQGPYCTRTLASFKTLYTRLEILIDIEYQPNAMNLFNRFKEKHSHREARPRFRVTGNHIRLGRAQQSTLVSLFHELNTDKTQLELDE